MHVLCVTAVLSLLSVSNAEPLPCEEIVKPLVLEDFSKVLGKWILIESAMDHPVFATILKSVNSSWVDVVATHDNDTVLFHEKSMLGGKCQFFTLNLTLSHNTIHFTRQADMKGFYNATLLRTSADYMVMYGNYSISGFSGKSFYLYGRTGKLSNFDRATYDRQMECLAVPKPNFIYDGHTECTKRKVDLAFLFDGSESLKGDDFQRNKNFIDDIMKTLSNTSIQFAAMQFSKFSRKVFTFKEYQEKKASNLLQREPHMKDLTNTYDALYNVVYELLNNTAAGAIPGAIKVLVIITDGNPSDTNWRKIVSTMDDMHIIRYVIAVGDVRLETLKTLSSNPKNKTTFYINNYGGLKGVLDSLQEQIFNIEGRTGKLSNFDRATYDRQMECLTVPKPIFIYDGHTELCPDKNSHKQDSSEGNPQQENNV